MQELIIAALALYVLLRLDLGFSPFEESGSEVDKPGGEFRPCAHALRSIQNEALEPNSQKEDEAAPRSAHPPPGRNTPPRAHGNKPALTPLPPGTRYVQHMAGERPNETPVSFNPRAKHIVEAHREAFPDRWYEARDELEDGTEVTVH